jgi:hypothetical protein
MIIYADGTALKADYFDNEGHVIRYVGQTRSAREVAFVSEPSASEPRYRLTYTLGADNTLGGQFEVAPPDGCVDQPRGKVRTNRAPPSGRFSARTLPPCSSTRCLTIANPRPKPPCRRVEEPSSWRNLSNR